MVFGVVGFEGSETSDSEIKQQSVGSDFLNHHRSGSIQDEWRSSKMAKIDSLSSSETRPLHQGIPLLRSNYLEAGQKELMLSFSSGSEASQSTNYGGIGGKAVHQLVYPYFQQKPSSYNKNAGFVNQSGRMHGSINAAKGPFTPSQWIELEHQSLIYKYITSNVAVPSNLLIPLKKSLYPFALTDSSGSLSSNSMGWGSFHVGFSSNTDPEPGRCRRTDGKKWRCSRDAVPDQKYCERHINRGRHRSRKPVEGQTGHTHSKLVPMASTINNATNGLGITPHQFKSLQPGESSYDSAKANRLSTMATTNLVTYDDRDLKVKQEMTFQESLPSEFGLVPTNSMMNESYRSCFMNPKSYGSFLNFNNQEPQDQHSLYQLIGQFPKDRLDNSIVTWPEELKSDWTQLSMSMSSSSPSPSPAQERLALSPLRLSRQIEPVQMSAGASFEFGTQTQKRGGGMPVAWETSIGGPLGEALKTTSNSLRAWDGSPQMGSSPTGVLQKATLCSLSHSSSGSSPRTENRILDGATLYEDVFGSTIASSSVPSLAPASDRSM